MLAQIRLARQPKGNATINPLNQMNPHKDDLEYVFFLNQLLRGKRLEGAAAGIAAQATDKGPDSLSTAQKAALDGAIGGLVSRECESCQNKTPWSEMYQAIDSKRCLACIVK